MRQTLAVTRTEAHPRLPRNGRFAWKAAVLKSHLGMGRYVRKFEGLASAKSSEVIDWLAPVLQGYLTGKLD